jgi:hypothetical protein
VTTKRQREAEAKWKALVSKGEAIADTAWPLGDDLPAISLVPPEVRQLALELLDEEVMPALRRLQGELRRLALAAVPLEGPKCQRCGRPIPPSTHGRIYCGRNCRQRASEERHGLTR